MDTVMQIVGLLLVAALWAGALAVVWFAINWLMKEIRQPNGQ